MLLNKWLVIQDDTVINIIVWDGVSAWAPPDGCTIIPAEDQTICIGWKIVDNVWVAPSTSEENTIEATSTP